jgi:hypothetical protein
MAQYILLHSMKSSFHQMFNVFDKDGEFDVFK